MKNAFNLQDKATVYIWSEYIIEKVALRFLVRVFRTFMGNVLTIADSSQQWSRCPKEKTTQLPGHYHYPTVRPCYRTGQTWQAYQCSSEIPGRITRLEKTNLITSDWLANVWTNYKF